MSRQGRRILITGVAGGLGAALAARLEADASVATVTGLDLTAPAASFTRTEVVRGDLRSPLVSGVLDALDIDTLVHLAPASAGAAAVSRALAKERTVIGALRLFGAAARARRLRTVLVGSSTALYGGRARNPSLHVERTVADAAPRVGVAADLADVEAAARTLARRRPDLTVGVLRFAPVVGRDCAAPLVRYLNLPVVPTVLGRDPRLQLLGVGDAVEILLRAVAAPYPGVVNVAAPGVVYLSQALRSLGRVAVPLAAPAFPALAGSLRRAGVDLDAAELAFLKAEQVAELSRLAATYGVPATTTRAQLAALARQTSRTPVVEDATLAALEQDLLRVGVRLAARRPGRPLVRLVRRLHAAVADPVPTRPGGAVAQTGEPAAPLPARPPTAQAARTDGPGVARS